MSEINIRPATAADLDIIVDFSSRLADESEGLELDRETLAGGVRSALEDSSMARDFLAEAAGDDGALEIVGQLMTTYEWSDWRNATFWWIQSVFVGANWRRKGVYRSMHNYPS